MEDDALTPPAWILSMRHWWIHDAIVCTRSVGAGAYVPACMPRITMCRAVVACNCSTGSESAGRLQEHRLPSHAALRAHGRPEAGNDNIRVGNVGPSHGAPDAAIAGIGALGLSLPFRMHVAGYLRSRIARRSRARHAPLLSMTPWIPRLRSGTAMQVSPLVVNAPSATPSACVKPPMIGSFMLR